MEAFVSEWSKESDLRSDIARCVGSNPTECNWFFFSRKKFVFFLLFLKKEE